MPITENFTDCGLRVVGSVGSACGGGVLECGLHRHIAGRHRESIVRRHANCIARLIFYGQHIQFVARGGGDGQRDGFLGDGFAFIRFQRSVVGGGNRNGVDVLHQTNG